MENFLRKFKAGFTLIELMVVIAIIAFLTMISIPSLMSFLAKAKRTEAYVNLSSLAMAQKSYFAEHGKYTTNLSGPGGLNWKPSGSCKYSYGFSGSEGKNYFSGQLNADSGALSQSNVSPDGFLVCAAADIDGDGVADIIGIDQDNQVKIIQDDLA